MRNYKTGATRSSADGKVDHLGFRNPITELAFGKYMLRHRVQEDGQLRAANNWWKGIDNNDTIQSLIRHTEDLSALHSGLFVYKIKDEDGEHTYYSEKPIKLLKGNEITVDETTNAIRFNSMSYLLNYIRQQYEIKD